MEYCQLGNLKEHILINKVKGTFFSEKVMKRLKIDNYRLPQSNNKWLKLYSL